MLSPALGGVVIGQEVGRALGVRAIFAERQDGALTLRRGFTLGDARSRARRRGRADDRRIDARDDARWRRRPADRSSAPRRSSIAAAAARCAFDVPFVALLEIALPTYEPEQCPLCAQGLPVVKPGSRPRVTRLHAGRDRLHLPMPRFKITLAYDGTDFVGWQRQADGVSIQGLLEDALRALDGRDVTVAGAGRTDAGVHALGQVAGVHARARRSTPARSSARSTRSLPRDVRVLDAPRRRRRRFTRASARAPKTYRYRIWNGDVLSPFERALRVARAGRARRRGDGARPRGCVEGRHDFAAFQAARRRDRDDGARRSFASSDRIARSDDRAIR